MAQTTPDASFGPVLVAAAQTNPSHPFETSIESLLASDYSTGNQRKLRNDSTELFPHIPKWNSGNCCHPGVGRAVVW